MTHKCQALVLHCMDHRFIGHLRDFIVSQGLKDQYDEVSVAGGTQGMVSGSKDVQEFILNQIGTACRLHSIQDVYLINHLDCGAYGGRKAFGSDQEEHDRHTVDLLKAKQIVNQQFPDLNVSTIIARLNANGGGQEVDFEVISG